MRVPDWADQLWKFAATGGAGLVANLLILTALVESGALSEAYAAVVSTLAVLAGGFLATDRWVFGRAGTDETSLTRRSGAYYAVMLGGKAVNYGIYLVLIRVGVWYPAAWVIGSVVVFLGTFSTNRYLWESVFGS